MGQARLAPERPQGSTDRFDLYFWRDLPQGGQRRRARSARLQHRGNEPASRRNRDKDRVRRPCGPSRRSGWLAHVGSPHRPAEHHHPTAATQMSGIEPAGKRVAVHEGQLDFKPSVQILRRHSRPLLRRLEQTCRSAMAHHVHRLARLGVPVLITENWYNETCARTALVERGFLLPEDWTMEIGQRAWIVFLSNLDVSARVVR